MKKELSVAQLERLLEKKRQRLDSLFRRRDELQKQLAQVESQIDELGGSGPKGRSRRGRVRKRPKNTKTLLQAMIEILANHKRGLSLRDLSAQIIASGYKTSSRDFENTVYQIIYNHQDKVAHDPKTKTYRLKASS
jgi:hypothetical protein